jgi:Fe-S-cluster-containing dehydrogenase component
MKRIADMSEQHKEKKVEQEKNISRRDILKLLAVGFGAITVTQVASLPARKSSTSETAESEYQWAMGIDTNLCIGCKYCTYACQAINDLRTNEMAYNVVSQETTPNGTEYFLSRPCMQCEEPPCVHVCPVEATYLRPDGIVTMDYKLCIGCRYCQVACPYDARVFNWQKPTGENPRVPEFGTPEVEPRPRGVMEKCAFCQHRIDAGLERHLVPGVDEQATPACVVACPTGARVFGNLKDPESPISKLLTNTTAPLVLREDLSTEPKVFYVPPREEA